MTASIEEAEIFLRGSWSPELSKLVAENFPKIAELHEIYAEKK